MNCGYDATYKYGLLYQWGRKYGQAYEDGTITPITLTKDEGNDYAFSGQFGDCTGNNNNWYSGSVDNTLWAANTKGTYDPCPTGWRVPTKDEFVALNKATKTWITNGGPSSDQPGCLFGTSPNQVFFPASGIRNKNDGTVSDRSTNGYYWSSSVTTCNVSASCLSFNNNGSVEVASGTLAGGRPVRCVQE